MRLIVFFRNVVEMNSTVVRNKSDLRTGIPGQGIQMLHQRIANRVQVARLLG